MNDLQFSPPFRVISEYSCGTDAHIMDDADNIIIESSLWMHYPCEKHKKEMDLICAALNEKFQETMSDHEKELAEAWHLLNVLSANLMDDGPTWPRVTEWIARNEKYCPENPIRSEPSFKSGDKAGFACESCGTYPTWGRAKRGCWLTCACWQGDIFADQSDVLAGWEKDAKRRTKANAQD